MRRWRGFLGGATSESLTPSTQASATGAAAAVAAATAATAAAAAPEPPAATEAPAAPSAVRVYQRETQEKKKLVDKCTWSIAGK